MNLVLSQTTPFIMSPLPLYLPLHLNRHICCKCLDWTEMPNMINMQIRQRKPIFGMWVHNCALNPGGNSCKDILKRQVFFMDVHQDYNIIYNLRSQFVSTQSYFSHFPKPQP